MLVHDEGDSNAGATDFPGELHSGLQLGTFGGAGGDFSEKTRVTPGLGEGVELCVEGLPGG